MSNTIPKKCPTCGEGLRVCLLACPACHTEIRGEFKQGRFARLTDEQFAFLENFLRCRGNMKDLCALVGISYPTARNRLEQLIEALGFEQKPPASARRMEILTQIQQGELTPEEAVPLLQSLSH